MKNGIVTILWVLGIVLISGCAEDRTDDDTGGWNFRCEEGETFVLSYEDDGKTAVLKMSGETRRLPLESSDGGLKFATEGMWLWTESRESDFAEVEDEGGHRNCHAQKDG